MINYLFKIKLIKGFEPLDKDMLNLKNRIIAIYAYPAGKIYAKDQRAHNYTGRFCPTYFYCRSLWDEFYKYAGIKLATGLFTCMGCFHWFSRCPTCLFLPEGLVRLRSDSACH